MATSTIPAKDEVLTTTLSGTYINDVWYLKKVGNIVFLRVINTTGIPAGSFTFGATIPAEYRPTGGHSFTVIKRNEDPEALAINVNQDGGITGYNYGPKTTGTTPYRSVLCWPTV